MAWSLCGLTYILHDSSKDCYVFGLCYLSLGPINFYLKLVVKAVVGLSKFLLLFKADLVGSARLIKFSKDLCVGPSHIIIG